ncbi:MAG: hypothetical protein ACMXYC_01395, partial [Candidatus Woesearchaeota archaeon]
YIKTECDHATVSIDRWSAFSKFVLTAYEQHMHVIAKRIGAQKQRFFQFVRAAGKVKVPCIDSLEDVFLNDVIDSYFGGGTLLDYFTRKLKKYE